MAILNNNPLIGSGGQQGYSINNSLRFRDSASAYLSRTPGTAGSSTTFTISMWFKRSTFNTSQALIQTAYDATNVNSTGLYFAGDVMGFNTVSNGGATTVFQLTTTQVLRDPSAWYHVVATVDTTQATASNRVKLYINGNQVTAFSTATYPNQNATTYFNTQVIHNIGCIPYSSGYIQFFDGYMADINVIDGSAKTPSDFGETDTTTGVWKPKAYTGTYGTNGFYLKFSDIATTSGSNAGLGKDFSGNSNYWTTNNISVTSGTTYDAMTDSPTNTSATVANYATLNPLSNLDATTLAAANLNFTQTTGSSSVFGTIGVSSGKWYWEVICQQGVMAGVADTQRSGGTYPGAFANSCAWDTFYTLNSTNTHATGTFTKAGTISGSAGTAGQVIGVALDMDAGTIVYYINGSVQNSGNAVFTNITGTVFPVFRGSTTTSSVNFGQRPFSYTPPTGYVALNTFNLPTSTIVKGNSYFDSTTYTGTGSSLAVVNAAGFKPDFVWGKDRGQAQSHLLFDSIRGVHNFLVSNSTAAEDTNNQTLTGFNSNGFQLGTNGTLNQNAQNFVGWQWQAGQGSTSSNTSGSITSTVSVNTTAGFSVVTYTGNGVSSATVGHGLGVAPAMVILKSRSLTSDWWVNHKGASSSWLQLNTTIEAGTGGGTNGAIGYQSTNTSTTFQFTAGSSSVNSVNTNGATYVAYCWAEIAGFSKFGSYTGNGSTDGPFIYTEFRPKFVMIKNTTTAGTSWIILDSSRNSYNVANLLLLPDSSGAEVTVTSLDLLSNGFKLRSTDGSRNASGATYIYMAFAENPFKNALAR